MVAPGATLTIIVIVVLLTNVDDTRVVRPSGVTGRLSVAPTSKPVPWTVTRLFELPGPAGTPSSLGTIEVKVIGVAAAFTV